MSDLVVYDMSVSPAGFDAVTFFSIADGICQQSGITSATVLIIPPSDEDAFWQAMPYGRAEFDVRLHRLIEPIPRLFATFADVIVCSDRDHAADLLKAGGTVHYPHDYSIDAPIREAFQWSILQARRAMGLPIGRPSVPDRYHTDVAHWLGKHYPTAATEAHKLCVLTVRYAGYNTSLNSDLTEWVKAAKWLQSKGFYPVFVPDTHQLGQELGTLFGGFPVYRQAAEELNVRVALYDFGGINIFDSCGPMLLNWILINSRSITFNMVDLEHPVNVMPVRSMGVEPGREMAHFSRATKLVWYRMSVQRMIDALNDLLHEPQPYAVERETLSATMRRFKQTGRHFAAFLILDQWSPQNTEEADARALSYAFHLFSVGQPVRANEWLAEMTEPISSMGLRGVDAALEAGQCLEHRGEVRAARTLYRKTLRHHPDHADLMHQLGRTYLIRNRKIMALWTIHKAMKLEPYRPEYRMDLARLFQALRLGRVARHFRASALQRDPQAH